MTIKCVGPIFDVSGYGEWARSFMSALIDEGADITISPISFEKNRPDLGELGEKLKSKINVKSIYDKVVGWVTPEVAYSVFQNEPASVKKINMTLWETTKIHPDWCKCISTFNELWVPGEWNKKVFKDSLLEFEKQNQGFESLKSLPIKVVHTPLVSAKEESSSLNTFFMLQDSLTGELFDNSYFAFYFISQWSERKNFVDLIIAYWAAFQKNEKVVLVLKTYLGGHTTDELDFFRRMLANLAVAANSQTLPKVCIINQVLSKTQMSALHKRGDCYVNPSRGEGLGLGLVEASLFGNPVITNLFGEQSTYYNESNAMIYGHTLKPVIGQNSCWYSIEQLWAAPDMVSLIDRLKYAFSNKLETKQLALNAKKDIEGFSNIKQIVKQIVE